MKTILCYGDSNTFGYRPEDGMRFGRGVRWPGKLQELLGDGYHVVEEGCNGRTTVFEEPGEEWKCGLSYLRPCLNSHKPLDLVVFMLGSNDLKTMFGADAEAIARGMDELLAVTEDFLAEKQGFVPEILLVSPPEIGEGIAGSAFRDRFDASAAAESRRFPELYRTLAETRGCRFLDAAAFARSSQTDSLHLEAEGHMALAEAAAEAVLGIFDEDQTDFGS